MVGLAKGGATVAAIEVEVRDALDHALHAFTAPAPRPFLAEGESARFRASFADPPAQGRSIQLRFAPVAPVVPVPVAEAPAPAAAERAPAAQH